MKSLRAIIAILSISQIIIWIFALRPSYAPEQIERVFFLLAAATAIFAAFKDSRPVIRFAKYAQLFAVIGYFVTTFLWVQFEGEALEGFLLLVLSGLILLIVVPPIASYFALNRLEQLTEQQPL